MTVCPHGSEVIPGKPTQVYVDLQYLYSLIPPGSEWIRPFLPFAEPVLIDTASFCVLEPPESPVFDTSDLINLIRPDPISLSFVAGQKLAQFIHEQLWYRLCRCLVDTTPAAPGLTAPTDVPAINPTGVVTAPQNTPCRSDGVTGYNPPGGTSFPIGTGLSLPNGASYLELTIQADQSATGTHGIFYGGFINFYRSDGQRANTQGADSYEAPIGPPSPAARTFRYTVPASAVKYEVQHTQTTTVGVDRLSIQTRVYCGGPPGDLGTCYADPYIRSTLSQLLGLVTLIQRQAVPFAYIAGESDAVTGDGQIGVQGLIGLHVELTTIPASLGSSDGTPDKLFDAGWVTWGTADGWARFIPLDKADLIDIPASAGAYTLIGYTLAPGVAATITQLVREA